MQDHVDDAQSEAASFKSAIRPAAVAAPEPAQQQQQQQQKPVTQPISGSQVADIDLGPHLVALVRSISNSCGSDIVPFLASLKPEDISGKFQHMSQDHGGCHPFAAMRHFKNVWAQSQNPSVPSDQAGQEKQHHPHFSFGGRGFKCGGGHSAAAPEKPLTLEQLTSSGFPREWAAAAMAAFSSSSQTKLLEVLSSFPFDASQAGVEALVNMGFDEEKARIAMLKSAGDACSWPCCYRHV